MPASQPVNQPTSQPIHHRLPHRPPFVMIDDIAAAAGSPARASFKIEADNVLVRDGFFTESGLVENMAQAAGAGLPQPADGDAPHVGYIGAVKDLHIGALPAVGDTIHTTVDYLHQVMSAHIVQAKVTDKTGAILASCELKIFLQF